MTMTKSNKTKRLALSAAMTLVLGGGATALLLPSFASASVATHSANDSVAHLRHGADDLGGASNSIAEAAHRRAEALIHHDSHGADDPAGHVRHGADDVVGHVRHGVGDAAVVDARHW
jgi:hypothetical protein